MIDVVGCSYRAARNRGTSGENQQTRTAQNDLFHDGSFAFSVAQIRGKFTLLLRQEQGNTGLQTGTERGYSLQIVRPQCQVRFAPWQPVISSLLFAFVHSTKVERINSTKNGAVMSPGLLVAWIVTLFGMIAGAAIVAAQWMPQLLAQVIALWVVFLFCTGAGVTAGMMFAPRVDAAPLMLAVGYFLLLLGVAAGALALAGLLSLFNVGFGLPLWLLFATCLPTGIVLAHSAQSMGAAAQRE